MRHAKAWVKVVHPPGVPAEEARRMVEEAVRALLREAKPRPRVLWFGGFEAMAIRRCVVVDKLRVCVTEESGQEKSCGARRRGCLSFAAEVVSIEPSNRGVSLEDAVGEVLKGGRLFRGVFSSLPRAIPPGMREFVRGVVLSNVGRVIDAGLYMRDRRYARRGFSHVPVRVTAPGGVEVRYRLIASSVPPLRVFMARGCSVVIGGEVHAKDCVLEDLFTVFAVEPLVKPPAQIG